MLGLVVLAAFVLVPTIGTYVDQRQQIAALEAAVEVEPRGGRRPRGAARPLDGPGVHHDAGPRAALLRQAGRGRLPRRQRPAAGARAAGAGAGQRRGRADAHRLDVAVRPLGDRGGHRPDGQGARRSACPTTAPPADTVRRPERDATAARRIQPRPSRRRYPGGVTTPPFPPVSDADLAVCARSSAVPRAASSASRRAACAATRRSPRPLRDSRTARRSRRSTTSPIPAATAAMSALEATQVMRELSDELAADEDLAAAYARAHEAYLARPRRVRRRRRDRRHLGRRHADPRQVPARARRPRARRRSRASTRSATARSRCRRGRPSAACAPSPGRPDDAAGSARGSPRRCSRSLLAHRRGGRRRVPADGQRPIRSARRSTGSTTTASRTRGRRRAARACASRSSTPASAAAPSSSRAPSSAAPTSRASARPTAARRSARSTRTTAAGSPRSPRRAAPVPAPA